MPKQILNEIYDKAKETGRLELVLAIIDTETNFNPYVTSTKDAWGLMQVRPIDWESTLKNKNIIKDKRELFLIENNIKAGFFVFQEYYKQTSDVEKALIKYVGGDSTYALKVLQTLGSLYLLKQ